MGIDTVVHLVTADEIAVLSVCPDHIIKEALDLLRHRPFCRHGSAFSAPDERPIDLLAELAPLLKGTPGTAADNDVYMEVKGKFYHVTIGWNLRSSACVLKLLMLQATAASLDAGAAKVGSVQDILRSSIAEIDDRNAWTVAV